MPSHMLPLLAGLVGLALAEPIDNLATTETGTYRGVILKTCNGIEFSVFRGIKFGKAKRFMAAVPPAPFSGIKNATKEGPACLQPKMPPGEAILKGALYNPPVGSDDCLYLNVYAPLRARNQSLPVMVWIHGGGWLVGSGHYKLYPPDLFMDRQNVIIVTINYRLSIMGFAHFNNETYPNNLGLKDQALALKWVQRNIAAFGGDLSRITLAGWSCGAASALMHSRLESNRGAFQGVIAQSGSPNAAWAVAPPWRAQKATSEVGKNIPKCKSTAEAFDRDGNGEKGGQLAECLQDVDSKHIISSLLKSKIPMGLVPTKEEESETAFLTKYPFNEKTSPVAVPLLTGTNSGETVKGIPSFELANKMSALAMYPFPYFLLKTFMLFGDTSSDPSLVEKKIRNNYSWTPINAKKTFQKSCEDYLFRYARLITTQQQNGTPTYTYFCDYITYPAKKQHNKVTGHGGELDLLFRGCKLEGRDKEVSQKLINQYIEFLNYGRPEAYWKPNSNTSSDSVLHINRDGSMNMGSDLSVKKDHVPKFFASIPMRDLLKN